MMPRRYTLGKRAESKADTRAQIVAAAMAIVRDQGLRAASTLAVARAADVAPATVRNHFPDQAALVAAVGDAVIATIQPPDRSIFDGVEGISARIRRLGTELATFQARSESWWWVYQRDPELVDLWSGTVARYDADQDALMRVALGPLGGDDTALAVLAMVVGPTGHFGLRGRGLSSDEAVEVALDVVVPWLEARARRR